MSDSVLEDVGTEVLVEGPAVRESPRPYMTVPQRGTRQLRLLVIDAHPVVQHGVRQFMEGGDRVALIDQAPSGREGINLARRLSPDVVLVDRWLPDMLLQEAVPRLHIVAPSARIVLFTTHISPSVREEVERLGIHGVVGKDASPDLFLEMIERVAAGEILTATAGDHVLRRAAEMLHCSPLTPREYEILQRAAHGDSNAEIAQAIYLAPTTVKSYLQSALRKLGARNRVEAVFKLSELRLL